jgi:hypothetical protein
MELCFEVPQAGRHGWRVRASPAGVAGILPGTDQHHELDLQLYCTTTITPFYICHSWSAFFDE